ncbi:DUF937 domain-containing protein [Phormidium tenue]|uniref:DUF937 domain-containing protein n=1 Tax=Phormidium tenue NIES-30 TaxID=549789 RepID=A0A1U7JB79_9CYAN|nr:DUF937 domain-containing protein [Phormidium tenue]MBD2230130.1 DUF937 domain-containing protein [Phormidium tenue FACHB-1052]OKH51038.1 DUF937 domain-containing protein [Phormidium tenue NIES-30]
MSLFFDVLSSINNPNQQGNIDQLSSVMTAVQQLASSQGMSHDQIVSILNALGGTLQPTLKQQAATLGTGQLEGMLGKLSGSGGAAALAAAIPPQMQQQMIEAVAQKSGLNAGTIQTMLPKLLPVVIGLLGMGAAKPGAVSGGNPLLRTFLDSGASNSTDLGTVVKFAERFLNSPQ